MEVFGSVFLFSLNLKEVCKELKLRLEVTHTLKYKIVIRVKKLYSSHTLSLSLLMRMS